MTSHGSLRSRAFLPVFTTIVLLAAVATRADLRLTEKASIGFPIDGIVQVMQIDAASDGAPRLVIAGSAYVDVRQWSPSRGTFVSSFFIQPAFSFSLASMAYSDVTNDGRNDIVLFEAYPGTKVFAYDSTTGAFLRSIDLAATPTYRFAPVYSRNLDGLPGDEMLAALEYGRGLVAFRNGTMLWTSPLTATVLPTSPAARVGGEVFLAAAHELIVLDGATGTERRRLTLPCAPMAVGQNDFDDAPEVACFDGGLIEMRDSRTGEAAWTSGGISAGITSVTMFDADGDGRDDVLVRISAQFYDQALLLVNGRNGVISEHTLPLNYYGFVAGLSGGCEPPSLVVTDGGGLSTPDRVAIVDGATLTPKLVLTMDAYGITGFATGDFSGHGLNELAISHDGKLATLSFEPNATGTVLPIGDGPWEAFRGVAAAQLDDDAPLEVVTSELCGFYTGCIKAWDPPKAAPLWQAPMEDGQIPRCTVIADVDGDGSADVLSGSIAVHSAATGEFAYAFRGRDGKQLWRSVNIPRSTGRVVVADVEGSGTPQVLVLSSSIGIVRLNRANGSVRGFYEFTGGSAFTSWRTAGDTRAKLIIAAADRLFVLDNGEVKNEIRSADIERTAEIEVADVDGDGRLEVLLSQAGFGISGSESLTHLQIRSLDTLALLWQSPDYPYLLNFTQAQQIGVADVDNDGRAEVEFLASQTLRILKPDALRSGGALPRFSPAAAIVATTTVHACCATVTLRWDEAHPGDAPPLQYRVYRSDAAGGAEALIATTSANEFMEVPPASAEEFRYSIAVADSAGNEAPERLHAVVRAVSCGRTGRGR